MQTLFIYFAVFVAVLIAVDALLRFLRTSMEKQKSINYRMSLLKGDSDRTVVYRQMLKERGLDHGLKHSATNTIKRYVSQSGLRLELGRAAFYSTAVCVVLFMLAMPLGPGLAISAVGAVSGTALAWVALVARRRQQRIRRFITQLPEALDVIVRSLAAGHPLPVSIALVAREMSDPIGSEFGMMSDELTYGTDIDTATRNMATRVGAEEINLLAISLTVQRGAGGNLAEILANLADMVRRRTMLKAKIKAISAEGRMTSWFMLLFPFGLYGMLKLLKPDYFEPLWQSGYGNMFLMSAAALMLIGMAILRKLVNFDY
jgi:tight adherence protein B